MPKKSKFDVLTARNELIELIDNFISLSEAGELRERVKALIPAFHLLRDFGTSVISVETKTSARERILIYLKQYPLTVIDSEELMIVSGITDYQRRIRELRVQFGWPLLSGSTVKALFEEGEWLEQGIDVNSIKPDEYVLLKPVQDRDAALRWNVINSIRREKISVKDKLIKYFRSNVGREITGEELAYLANGATEWGRRARELRTEEGWPIKTCNSGRPDLSVGVYVLEEDKQAQVHDRKIDDSTRVAVLTRDKFCCRKCGWSYSVRQNGDPRQLLELHHLDYHADKGANTLSNLITICNVDHDEIHRIKMSKEQVLKWVEERTHM